jgi:hypothetical protein
LAKDPSEKALIKDLNVSGTPVTNREIQQPIWTLKALLSLRQNEPEFFDVS